MTAGAILLNVVLLAAALPVSLAAFYLLLLTVLAFVHPARRRIDGRFGGVREARTRFVILIPAHNEEMLLGTVLERLRRQSYPADKFTLAVIADNCEDRTAEIARQGGATVFERADRVNRGKGQALNWAMRERLPGLPGGYDAVVILDADSFVNDDFLWFLDETVVAGHEAMQGYYGVQNPLDNWRTSMLTVSLAAFHFLRPLGRDRMGLPCGLKGNGMCFSRRLVERFGYPASSVVEDVELALFYLRQGIRVKFVPGAQVFGQMAVSGAAAGTQRARWEGGRLALIRAHAWPMLREGLRMRDAARMDAAIDLLVPPFALLAMLTAAPAVALSVWWALAPGLLWAAVPVLWLAALLADAIYVLGSLVLVRAPFAIYRRMAAAPLYVFWKLGVYAGMAFKARRASAEWVRTARHEMEKKD